MPLPEKGKRSYYSDTKETGLIVDVRSSGSKSFYLYKKINGRPERILLGQYPDMKIPQARREAAVKRGEIAKGINPQEEKRKIRQEITFGAFFEQYMERHSKPYKRSWKYDEREVNKFLSHWMRRKMSSITRHDVLKLQEDLRRNHGPYQANRMIERIRGIFSKAIQWGWEGNNPASGIKKFKEKSRDRFIQPSEMPLFFQSLAVEENETARDYIYLSLMTGARKANVLAMRWDEINWELEIWRIPETKNGESLIIPLIPEAFEVLKRRKEKARSEWVFENDEGTAHLADPKKAWDRVRERATIELWKQTPRLAELIEEVEEGLRTANNYGYTIVKLYKTVCELAKKRDMELPVGLMDLRLHDIRRTLGSYQAITGASLQVIGKSLGHKSQAATQVYSHLNLDPVRASVEKATAAMFAAGKR